jgi:flagellar protein FlaG
MINSVNTGLQQSGLTAGVQSATKSAPSVDASSVQSQDTAVDATQLDAAVSKLNDYVQNVQRNLSFSVDKDTGETVIKVYDAETKEVIRQLPPDETLKLAAVIDKQVAHLFVKERA